MDGITLNWPGGEHTFALRLGELRKMQDTCNAGPEEVLTRLRKGTWRVDDVIEPLRLGLIGAGMTASEAGPLVTKLFQQHPIVDFRIAALSVVAHALYGPPDDMPEKPQGATMTTEDGSSQPSTASEDT